MYWDNKEIICVNNQINKPCQLNNIFYFKQSKLTLTVFNKSHVFIIISAFLVPKKEHVVSLAQVEIMAENHCIFLSFCMIICATV